MKMPTIPELRNRTQIIAEDALEGILERFTDFVQRAEDAYADWQSAFDVFFEPVDYFAYLAFQGIEVVADGKVYVIKTPNNHEYDKKGKKVSMPTQASAPIGSRFGGHRSPCWPEYPVDADTKIYFECCLKNPETTLTMNRSIAFSYNQLAGRCKDGRIMHWIEGYDTGVPTNRFLAELNKGSWGPADPLYRKTPDGQPKVNEILKPGTLVELDRGGASARRYIVSSVTGPYIYRPIERPDDHVFETFSISMIDPVTKKGGYVSNSLVAVDGKIMGLFFADEETIEIIDVGLDCTAVEEDEDDDFDELECGCTDEVCTPIVPIAAQMSKSKPIQLSLF